MNWQRFFHRLLHLPRPPAGDVSINLSQHQAGNGMIVNRRVRRSIIHMHRFGKLRGKKPVGPLAGNDEINPLLHRRAVRSQARLMAPGKKGQHTRDW